jgi:hypothetical protein
MKKQKLFKIFLIISLFSYFSCNTIGPPPPNNGLVSISLTDVSCTEAWVNLKINGLTFPVNVNLLANNSIITQLNNLRSSDTTIYIDSLLPNKSYQLQAQLTQGFPHISSNQLPVQTLDTTSHNFTWQTFNFQGFLYDIAIVNEENIWAVGAIYLNDSTGNTDYNPYCLAHWNGTDWKLSRLTFDGIPLTGTAIFANSENDIWLAAGAVFHYDGVNWNPIYDSTGAGGAVRIWSDGGSNVWFVGPSVVGLNGYIVHYNGSTWQKIEAATQYSFTDVWGLSNMSTVSKVLTCMGPYGPGESTIFSLISGSAIDTLDLPGERIGSIWTFGMKTFAGGNKTWESTNNIWKQVLDQGSEIRGTGYNNIIAGQPYVLSHFNGISWKTVFVNGNYSINCITAKGNIVAMAGIQIVVIGKH